VVKNNALTFQLFVVKLYGLTGNDDIASVDAARQYLFFHRGRDFTHLPPSSDALHQHLLRVAYQVFERHLPINLKCIKSIHNSFNCHKFYQFIPEWSYLGQYAL